jgi:hypothetical protein
MAVPVRLMQKLVLAFGVAIPAVIVAARSETRFGTLNYRSVLHVGRGLLLNLKFRSLTASKDL